MLFNLYSFMMSIALGELSVYNGDIKERLKESSLPDEVKYEIENQLCTFKFNEGGCSCNE